MPLVKDPQLLAILAFALTFIAIVGIGGAILLTRTARRRRALARLPRESSDLAEDEAHSKGGQLLLNVASKIGFSADSSHVSPGLRKSLTNAGYYRQNAPAMFMGAKVILLSIGLLALPILLVATNLPLHITILLSLIVAMLLFTLPNILLSAKRKARCTEIRRYLPNAVDLLDVCVSAGLGLSAAWNMVADEMYHVSQCFADEMALTNLEVHLGLPRATAMRNFSDRTGVEEIATLSAVLVQSEKFGTDVATALRSFATSMREDRSANSEEIAERMAVRLLFPMVLFIFPAMFVVVVGPASMVLMKMLSGG